MPDFADKRMPPVTSILGRACYECFKFKDKDRDILLRKCAGCLAVQYCSAECQKANWKSEHREVCNALQSLENDATLKLALLSSIAHEPSSDPHNLDRTIMTIVTSQIQYLQRVLSRNLTTLERNLLAFEPRCMACARTDRIIRIEAAEMGSLSKLNMLKPCPTCKMDFYCSNLHRDAVQSKHTGKPCPGGHDGLSQCQMNQEIRGDVAFSFLSTRGKAGPFRWAPERVKPSWMSLKGTNWEAEFVSGLAKDYRISSITAGPLVRAASQGLSMPMTILWALEHLKVDDSWTHKNTLIIHVLGAYEAELMNGTAFEEILHRLPEVKHLKLVLCGPELDIVSPEARNQEINMDTCRNCTRRRRTRVHQLVAQKYHDFARSLGNQFIKPDLAVAFNSGMSQDDIQSWKGTISFLVKNKIPSVFTAYNQDEAESEARLLQAAGAKLVPSLGPGRNAWGSTLALKEPVKVTGFYAENFWLSGGFR